MTNLLPRGRAALCAFIAVTSLVFAGAHAVRAQETVPAAKTSAGQRLDAAPVVIVNPDNTNCNFKSGGNCAAGGGGSTASLAPWTPDNGSLQTLAPTGASSLSSAFGGSGTTVYVKNIGAVPVHVRPVLTTGTATVADERLLPGMCGPFALGTADRVALITDSGTGSVEVTTGTGNPGFGVCVDGSSSSAVAGDVTDGAADSGKAVKTGGKCKTSAPAIESDGDRVPQLFDCLGKPVTTPYALPASLVSGLTAAMTGTTSTAVTGIGAPGAGLFNYVTTIACGNSHATVGTFVEFQDGSGGTTFFTIPAGAVYAGAVLTFPAPLKQPTANTALFVKDTTTGANVICSVAGFKAP